MIKFPTISYKNTYNTIVTGLANQQLVNNNSLSFGQKKYDFFEKGMSEKNTPNNDKKYSFLESEQIKSNSIKNSSYVKAPDDTNLGDALAMAGFVGIPFLLSVALASAIAKGTNPEDIFLPDGTYLCNAKELSVKSSTLEADGDDGVLKLNGTSLNIDKNKYDENLSIPEKGIYKSADGKLDIDLLNNKYIDRDNGIVVEPDANISAFMTVDGSFKSLPLHNFGSGYPTNPWTDGGLPLPSSDYDSISFFEKLKDFFHIGNSDMKNAINTYENSLAEQIREKIADSSVQEYIKQNGIDNTTAENIVQYAEDIRLKEYMLEHHPSLADHVNIESIDSFIQNLHSHNTDFDTASGLIDIVNDNNDVTDIF